MNLKDERVEKIELISNIHHLKKTQYFNKIQQAALTVIALQTGPQDVQDLNDIFLSMDRNRDGELSFEEIELALKNLKLKDWETVLEQLKRADNNKSGSINYTEFITATLDSQIYLREDYLK
jgi:calcium-dependent protein kinase